MAQIGLKEPAFCLLCRVAPEYALDACQFSLEVAQASMRPGQVVLRKCGVSGVGVVDDP